MLELKRRQRGVLIDKLPDAANVAAGALLFGQFLSEQAFSLGLAIVGGAVWMFFLGCAVALATRDD